MAAVLVSATNASSRRARVDLELVKGEPRPHERGDERVGVLDPGRRDARRRGSRRRRRPAGAAAVPARNATRVEAAVRAASPGRSPSSATRPAVQEHARVTAISSASSSCWVVRRTEPPVVGERRRVARAGRAAPAASIPAVGSSRKSARGSPASASATASRRRCPPESPAASRSVCCLELEQASARRVGGPSRDECARTRSTASRTRRPGGNPTSCSTAPTRRRRPARAGRPPEERAASPRRAGAARGGSPPRSTCRRRSGRAARGSRRGVEVEVDTVERTRRTERLDDALESGDADEADVGRASRIERRSNDAADAMAGAPCATIVRNGHVLVRLMAPAPTITLKVACAVIADHSRPVSRYDGAERGSRDQVRRRGPALPPDVGCGEEPPCCPAARRCARRARRGARAGERARAPPPGRTLTVRTRLRATSRRGGSAMTSETASRRRATSPNAAAPARRPSASASPSAGERRVESVHARRRGDRHRRHRRPRERPSPRVGSHGTRRPTGMR